MKSYGYTEEKRNSELQVNATLPFHRGNKFPRRGVKRVGARFLQDNATSISFEQRNRGDRRSIGIWRELFSFSGPLYCQSSRSLGIRGPGTRDCSGKNRKRRHQRARRFVRSKESQLQGRKQTRGSLFQLTLCIATNSLRILPEISRNYYLCITRFNILM